MSRQFEKDICVMLGLGDRKIKELTIKCAAGELTTIHTVEFLINPNVSVDCIHRTFELVERKDAIRSGPAPFLDIVPLADPEHNI